MFIADIGINHNGNIDTALELISFCKTIGVDVVKFQKRNPEICVPENQKHVVKDTIFGKLEYIDYKKMMEFGKKEYDIIDKYCKEIGIKWSASVWDIDSYNFISQYDVPFIKIPSACLTKTKLLKKISKSDKPIIISIGMSTESDVKNAINIFKNNDVTILHCVSSYPTNPEDADLNYIKTLKSKYPDKTIGYSGHEIGYLQTIVASVLGADVIERHITLSHDMKGTDHKSSLNIYEFKEMIDKINFIKTCLGSSKKRIHESEVPFMNKLIY